MLRGGFLWWNFFQFEGWMDVTHCCQRWTAKSENFSKDLFILTSSSIQILFHPWSVSWDLWFNFDFSLKIAKGEQLRKIQSKMWKILIKKKAPKDFLMLASSLFKFYSNIHFLYFLLRYETCQLKGVVWDGSSSYSNIEANNVLCCHTPTSHKIGTNQDIWLNIWASNIHFSVLAVALWNLSIKGNKFSSYSNIEANNVLCCHPPTHTKLELIKAPAPQDIWLNHEKGYCWTKGLLLQIKVRFHEDSWNSI